MDHIATKEAGTDEGRVPDGPIPSFLAGLAQAMHAAVSSERERIAEVVAADARAQAEKAQARAAIEVDALRRSADEDIRGIEEWASRQVKRIRREAARRTKKRRAELASYLERHEAIIAMEIVGVETAVAAYSAQLDRFVEDLGGSDDPADIARLADAVPLPPDLDEARARARADAVAAYEHVDDPSEPVTSTEPETDPRVGVMDPEAEGRPGDLPIAVDPPPVPEEEPPVFAETAGSAYHANGALRLFRALTPWVSGSTPPTEEDAETRQG
jgi:hypothetical protein